MNLVKKILVGKIDAALEEVESEDKREKLEEIRGELYDDSDVDVLMSKLQELRDM